MLLKTLQSFYIAELMFWANLSNADRKGNSKTTKIDFLSLTFAFRSTLGIENSAMLHQWENIYILFWGVGEQREKLLINQMEKKSKKDCSILNISFVTFSKNKENPTQKN